MPHVEMSTRRSVPSGVTLSRTCNNVHAPFEKGLVLPVVLEK